jgi:hypothetical protein
MKNMIFILAILIPGCIIAQSGCKNEYYAGSDRKASKTSISSGPTTTYNTLSALQKTLPTDEYMRRYEPPISRESDSQRVTEENQNVTVNTAYIFVLYRESDNDYHIIVGSDVDTTKALLMNIEVSGLPDSLSPDFDVLKAVRGKITGKFGKICSKKVICIDDPVKVSITGSLFYDIDHKPGIVGHKNLKPKTAWEIHPVTDIVFK